MPREFCPNTFEQVSSANVTLGVGVERKDLRFLGVSLLSRFAQVEKVILLCNFISSENRKEKCVQILLGCDAVWTHRLIPDTDVLEECP